MVEVYESEEAQVEALKAWWKENGKAVIVGAILGFSMLGGWNFWQAQQREQAEEASTLYSELLNNIQTNKVSEAKNTSQSLMNAHNDLAYADYARLIQSKLEIDAGNFVVAKALLTTQMQESDVELQNIARIRLVRLMLSTAEYEAGLQLISEVNLANSSSFDAIYDELTGDLYVALDRLGEARTAYEKALRSGQASPLLQFKLDDITAPEIISPPAN